ncbi:DUF1453 domain-containing protein [Actinosynnema sp. NPDC050436]|uniref:DUF1453 domain-containing protein n=1 Tax=Actinosynnema sp. NPDC050436 TaxID=3155659 RepID=UPI003411E42F
MLTWVLIGAAVVAVVVKRVLGEPLNGRDLVVPPLVLLGIGGYELTKTSVTAVDVLWLVGGVAMGLALGVLRGATIKVYERDDVLWQRYTPWTLAVWVGSFAVNAGLGFAASASGVHADARPMALSIGVGLLGELVPVGLRAIRSGVPFAPERR